MFVTWKRRNRTSCERAGSDESMSSSPGVKKAAWISSAAEAGREEEIFSSPRYNKVDLDDVKYM